MVRQNHLGKSRKAAEYSNPSWSRIVFESVRFGQLRFMSSINGRLVQIREFYLVVGVFFLRFHGHGHGRHDGRN